MGIQGSKWHPWGFLFYSGINPGDFVLEKVGNLIPFPDFFFPIFFPSFLALLPFPISLRVLREALGAGIWLCGIREFRGIQEFCGIQEFSGTQEVRGCRGVLS